MSDGKNSKNQNNSLVVVGHRNLKRVQNGPRHKKFENVCRGERTRTIDRCSTGARVPDGEAIECRRRLSRSKAFATNANVVRPVRAEPDETATSMIRGRTSEPGEITTTTAPHGRGRRKLQSVSTRLRASACRPDDIRARDDMDVLTLRKKRVYIYIYTYENQW